jgi:hypothetical protein
VAGARVGEGAVDDDASADPCEGLAYELAAIVFENYGLVDELNDIRVVIGSEPHDLNVEASDVMLEKSFSIAEWRNRIGGVAHQGHAQRKGEAFTVQVTEDVAGTDHLKGVTPFIGKRSMGR